MENRNLEKIVFEDRAWIKAEYPRLHMKEPETLKFTKTENFTPIDKEIHLEIGYHRGKKTWYLQIYYHQGLNCSGKVKFFSSIQNIKQYIRDNYDKDPILPERWN